MQNLKDTADSPALRSVRTLHTQTLQNLKDTADLDTAAFRQPLALGCKLILDCLFVCLNELSQMIG